MADSKVYLPKQRTRHGVAGYRGDNIEVVDASGKKDAKATADAAKSRKAQLASRKAAAKDDDE